MNFFFLLTMVLLIGFLDNLNTFVLALFLIVSLLINGPFNFFSVIFVDTTSFFLLSLCVFLFLPCLTSEYISKWNANNFTLYNELLLLIFFNVFLCFCCTSALLFYFCFEFTFILMLIFVLGWGYSPERLQASFYIVFYTLLVSFPFIFFLIFHWFNSYSTSLIFPASNSSSWWFFLCIVFLVNLPAFSVHLWLPNAHVEAPVSGSIVLAGLLLNLGGYGLLRFASFLKNYYIFKDLLLVSVGFIGAICSCLLCLRQSDINAFVAYSSVSHISMALASLCSGSSVGVAGTLIIMVSHGFCSSCLFYLLYIFYNRWHSRSLLISNGFLYTTSPLVLSWFVFSVLNMGVPPSLAFFSEVTILNSLASLDLFNLAWLGCFLLLGGVYCVYLYAVSNHGTSFIEGFSLLVTQREYLVIYSHFLPLIWISPQLSYFY